MTIFYLVIFQGIAHAELSAEVNAILTKTCFTQVEILTSSIGS